MKHYRGNQMAPAGVYVDLRHMSLQSLDRERPLPGNERSLYRRVPALALVFVGPLLGGLYVVLLPVIGFAMLAWFAGRKAATLAPHAAEAVGRFLRPPGAAGKRNGRTG